MIHGYQKALAFFSGVVNTWYVAGNADHTVCALAVDTACVLEVGTLHLNAHEGNSMSMSYNDSLANSVKTKRNGI